MNDEPPQPSKLTDHLGYWMRLVSNHVSHAFARKLESTPVTVAEWVVLREMWSAAPVTSPGALAEVTGLTRGAVSKLVSRLVEKRLVVRAESTNDRRFQDIALTPEAMALIPILAGLADDNDEAFFSVLTADEAATLARILRKLAGEHQLTTMPID